MSQPLCAEELELAALSAAILQGKSSDEALNILWPLLTDHIPTLERRAALTEALLQDDILLELLTRCGENLRKLTEVWNEYQNCAAAAAASRTAAGLIGFVRGFEKITGRNTGGVIESDAQRRDYYSNLFRSAYLGLRAAALYFHTLEELHTAGSHVPKALQPLFDVVMRLWQEDGGSEILARLSALERDYPEVTAFALEITYSRDQHPSALSVSDIRTEPFQRDGLFSAKQWDGLSSSLRFPQLSSSESFRSLILAELGSALRSKLTKLQKELSHFSIRGVETLAAYGEELTFFTSAAQFGKRLAEKEMPVCIPKYRKQDSIAEINRLYCSVSALYSGQQVASDVLLGSDGAFSILTGANGSGKTAYLISVGQAMWLSMLGCPLPASEAELSPPDQICCLFAAGESETGADSRMGLETARLGVIERTATSKSLVLMNEPFTSTSAAEAIEICSRLICSFCENGIHGMLVTHYSEIYDAAFSSLEETGLSGRLKSLTAVSEHRPEGVRHTYHITEGPPIRSGYAERIAAACGVSLLSMLKTLKDHGVDLSPAIKEGISC